MSRIMQLNLLVLRCENIEKTRVFYEKLNLSFQKEKHGKGVEHYSTYIGKMVLELYPLKEEVPIENIRLGFSLDFDIVSHLYSKQIDMVSRYEFDGRQVIIVQDPDGRKIELSEAIT